MLVKFSGKRISGVLGLLPENEYDYDEETKDFATLQTRRLKKIMGFGKRRAAKETSVTSDFCLYGLRYALEKEYIKKEEIGAIIVVGLTPDYYLPHISNIIQGELELDDDVVCIDIPQGCAGYILGLYQSCMMLEHMERKVLLFTGDVLCRKNPEWKERTAQFGGDAASLTIIENCTEENMCFDIKMNGKEREALWIPAGGYKMPRSAETANLVDCGDGTLRTYEQVWMDGSKVFNFVQKEVPPMLDELFHYAEVSKDEIDWFLFHQPNKFMLQKLADKIEVSYEKMPMNIVENFGNSSGSTVPINITFNVGAKLLDNRSLCCLSGFGSGLSWAGCIANLGYMDFCELVVTDV